jgi:hypothetical protein
MDSRFGRLVAGCFVLGFFQGPCFERFVARRLFLDPRSWCSRPLRSRHLLVLWVVMLGV